jgi:hypothetical protein
LIFTTADLIKRARAYAPADLLLFKKHPRLLGSGTGPFGRLDDDWAAKTKDSLDNSRPQVAEFIRAIARFDTLDFAPLFSLRKGEGTEAEIVLRAFDHIVPQVHWFHLFETLLELRGEVQNELRDAETLEAIRFQPSAFSEETGGVLADS